MSLAELLNGADARPALCDGHASLSRAELTRRVHELAGALRASGVRTLAILLDNGIDWVVADLAAASAGLPVIPLPPFFSAAQSLHVLQSAGVDGLIGGSAELAEAAGYQATPGLPGLEAPFYRRAGAPVAVPAGTAKITFTSGTTGTPKGVCLSAANQLNVARSLVAATAGLGIRRHLCLLPLAVLLENIAGVYAPLLAGAQTIVPPLAEVGLSGSSGFEVATCLRALHHYQAESVILLPQMLHALIHALELGAPRPQQLRFIAVGGGKVAGSLLARADALGLPVFEGYGLSECASVVALNTPTARRAGSVGKPLPHVEVSVSDGEIRVAGNRFLGYLGEAAASDDGAALATGDLGHVDADGFLVLDGRRKNLIITAFGRNLSPEWPEAELTAHPAIAQAAVFGEARPYCVAVIVPRRSELSDTELAGALASVNARLPDYAQIRTFVRAHETFSQHNGLLTANGRVRREAIAARYAAPLAALYGADEDATCNAVTEDRA